MTTSWLRTEVTLAPGGRGSDLEMADRLGIGVATAIDPTQWQLIRTVDRIELRTPTSCGRLALEVSLRSGPLVQRLRSARKTDALPRACGIGRQGGPPLRMVDATAGLGRDAMVMASLGCEVIAIERLPALVFLLADAVAESSLARSITVIAADATTWLTAQGPDRRPQVIYLDPMFGSVGKAQVKKDMQICRLLAGAPDDPAPLLAAARATATERVVVKRHHGEAAIATDVSFAVAGERVRFDVYLTPAAPR